MKRDGVSHDVSMCPCTNPLILIMGISLLPVARSLLPFKRQDKLSQTIAFKIIIFLTYDFILRKLIADN
ncbi:MAG: hypothetical protein V7K67_21885 [Nostoc sp.]